MSLAFLICLLIFATLGHGYLWTDAVNQLHACAAPRKQIDRLTLTCLAAFLIIPAVILVRCDSVGILSVPLSMRRNDILSMYILSCGVWGIYALLRNWTYDYLRDDPRVLLTYEREFVDTQGYENTDLFRPGFASFLSNVPANQILKLAVDRKRLAIPHLSQRHEGLTIAHISDLHMTGRIGQSWYEFVVEQVNLLNADAVVITGDIVEKQDCWPWLAESLGKLRAECGVYFILGNHDYYIDTHETRRLLEDSGLVCLSDCHIERQWNGAPVQLAGNELPWGPQPTDLSSLPEKSESGLPLRLVLLHSPDQLHWACENQAHLALAGHTHGGQLRFPILGPIISPSRHGIRYASGVFRRQNTVLHVTRGITGKTPLRWNCPPEISLLELVRA